MTTLYLGIGFLALAMVFIVISLRDHRANGNRLSIAGKVRLKLAGIFTLVATALFVLIFYIAAT